MTGRAGRYTLGLMNIQPGDAPIEHRGFELLVSASNARIRSSIASWRRAVGAEPGLA